jgi:hypothetical protein
VPFAGTVDAQPAQLNQRLVEADEANDSERQDNKCRPRPYHEGACEGKREPSREHKDLANFLVHRAQDTVVGDRDPHIIDTHFRAGRCRADCRK